MTDAHSLERPVRTIVKPSVLKNETNGQLDPGLLVHVPGQAGGPVVRLVAPAARAWKALCAAALEAGHTLKATSAADSYRTFDQQKATFLARYQTTKVPGESPRKFNGTLFYLKKGQAEAAVPGHSNHGLGLAVDTGEERDHDNGTEELSDAALIWLIDNEVRFGFSHEDQREAWHIRYFPGDAIPDAVKAFEMDMHAPGPNAARLPTPADDEDDMTPEQFLQILRDEKVQAEMRRLPWQYTDDDGLTSAHSIVLGEMRVALKRMATTIAHPAPTLHATLTAMAPAAIADAVTGALSADAARQVLAELTAKLRR
jgi:hypothetical protein